MGPRKRRTGLRLGSHYAFHGAGRVRVTPRSSTGGSAHDSSLAPSGGIPLRIGRGWSAGCNLCSLHGARALVRTGRTRQAAWLHRILNRSVAGGVPEISACCLVYSSGTTGVARSVFDGLARSRNRSSFSTFRASDCFCGHARGCGPKNIRWPRPAFAYKSQQSAVEYRDVPSSRLATGRSARVAMCRSMTRIEQQMSSAQALWSPVRE